MAPHRPRGRAIGSRDPWLDNAKMLLVTLVVVRHSWMLLPPDGPNGRIGEFLYVWHMPAFILVTGYLSRGFAYTPKRMWGLCRTVVAPYLLFELAMVLFRDHVGGERISDVLRGPVWPLWFLSSLFFWRLSVPLFKRLPGAGVAVATAVGISLLAGMHTIGFLDLDRMLGMLPFFVVGAMITPERLELLRSTPARLTAVVSLIAIWVLSSNIGDWASADWLYYKDSYADMGVSTGPALVIRVVMIAAALIGSFAFLALMPRRDGWFARMGKWTLVVYLFHGFVVKSVGYTDFPAWAAHHAVLGFVVASSVAVVIALLLAFHPLARRLEPITDPLRYGEKEVGEAVDLAAAAAAPFEAPVPTAPVEGTPVPAAPVEAGAR